jgi:crotonobetainyl-CoA:carnitine CoA-transferase CaiB-like acyl-CoA transferase
MDAMTVPAEPPPPDSASVSTEQVEARARMRRKLAEARERHDATYWAGLREKFGLPARTS